MAEILIVEDEHALGGALAMAVMRLGHKSTLVASGAAALHAFEKTRFDAVILDIGLPDMNGLSVLEKIRNDGNKTPVVILTAHGTLDHTISAQKLGITDFLMKPVDLARFEAVIESLVASNILVTRAEPPGTPTLIGGGPGMHRVFLGIARACHGDLPIMIMGPSGSGKTLAARLIHTNSKHGNDELFRIHGGMIKHSSALQAQLSNHHGTLLIEDLDALPDDLQHELAQVMENRSTKTPRLIATIQNNPSNGPMTTRLRTELFYAFSVLTIEMPPLKDRSGDIPELCRFFHGMHAETKGANFEISSAALSALQAYPWPGNIRELQSVLEHAWALSRGEVIYPGHLPPHVAQVLQTASGSFTSSELESVISRWLEAQMEILPEDSWSYDKFLEGIEASMLKFLLEKFDSRPTRLATALGMNRATLRQKLRRYGLRDEG
jgi:DNA-binding NtrC family response regulator